MGDSWEDWEDEDVVVPVSIVANPGRSKFEDEDAEEEAPGWEGSIPEPQLVSTVSYVCYPFIRTCPHLPGHDSL